MKELTNFLLNHFYQFNELTTLVLYGTCGKMQYTCNLKVIIINNNYIVLLFILLKIIIIIHLSVFNLFANLLQFLFQYFLIVHTCTLYSR